MIISKTPFRISFFGGGTDYPVWYEKNGGSVLSTTIDKYCYINIRYLPPFFDYKYRIIYSLIESVNDIEEIKHPVVKALIKLFKVKDGIEMHYDADLPARSGLGSSSAFTVGMLNVLYALNGKIISKKDLAKHAINVERNILRENVGSQDQVAVAHGGFNKIIFHNNHEFKIEPVTVSREKLLDLNDHLMLIFTGFSRIASEIAAEQIKNTVNRQAELKLMSESVDSAVDILNSRRNIIELGKLLHENWRLKKSLSKKISNRFIDNIYETAQKNGAIGGKLLGAGGGGFMLLFVPPAKRRKVRKSLAKLLEIKFSFENNGSQIIYYNP